MVASSPVLTPQETTPMPAIEAHGVAKAFGAIQALRGVNLTLYPGEIHALLGENGAGKSTLVKILAGVLQPDAGELRIQGEPVSLHSPLDARARGIAVIHQHPTLFPDLDVAENIRGGGSAASTGRRCMPRQTACSLPWACTSMPPRQCKGFRLLTSSLSRSPKRCPFARAS